MNKRRRHQDRREVVVTPEEDEVAEIRKEIPIEPHIKIQTKIGKCPPKANQKKEVGKSTKGKVHQAKQSQLSKVASSNLLNPRTRKTSKKQIPEVKITKFQRKRRKQERMTLRRPSNTRSIKHYQT
jgi:coenzyme F420-reducing hydrogenase gamma subunit